MEHLPESEQSWVARKMEEVWHDPNPDCALESLKVLATWLDKDYPGAVRSLREGLEETLTAGRLHLPQKLYVSLSSTNIIECANDKVQVTLPQP
ncbi:hypothetical protein kuro4_20280 [Gelria sp. Kuro-4]|nr:hypothetical protein kuro4_20280 [Gelria sp. Kuro-4]